MVEKLLVFDIWGDYAYFRRGYTTTSTISYPFPSRTTIAGFISGILGYDRDTYYDIFNEDNSKIGLNILEPIKKTRINLNYINTKEGFLLSDIKSTGKRNQVRAEFLKDVKYRIYVSLEDSDIMDNLYNLLNEHKAVFTPYLGISECLANFKLVGNGFFEVNKQYGNNINIDSIILKKDNNIIVEPNKKYGLVKTPGFFNNERIVEEFLEFYYEENGSTIKIHEGEYYRIGDDNVILF